MSVSSASSSASSSHSPSPERRLTPLPEVGEPRELSTSPRCEELERRVQGLLFPREKEGRHYD